MNFETPSCCLISLFIAVDLIETLAQYLNLRASKIPLSSELRELQSPSDQLRASQYMKDRIRMGIIKRTLFLAVFIALIKLSCFETLQELVVQSSNSPLIQSLLFVVALLVGQAILNIPFQTYSTFVIEAKYGFNRTTIGIFISDLLKGALVGGLLGGLVFAFIVRMLTNHGDQAWWMIWLGYTGFQFLLVWIAPITLLPLFLKLTPLSEGPLRAAIESYSQKQTFKLDGVWVCDASKRSAKSNAFFTGFGKFRRLVLFDTLIERHPPEEIVAIVAHEAGHFKLGHIWKLSIFSALSSLLFFYVIQKLISWDALYLSFGATKMNMGIGLTFAAILVNKALYFLSPIGAYFSRRNEYAADRFSVQTTGDAASLVNGLKRLVNENLATLNHHPLSVILHDSHPPLPDRIKPWAKN